MSGNSIGVLFKVTTWGESHGPAVGAVVDGCPSLLPLGEEDIQRELDRRRPGKGPGETARAEPDRVRILSGVFEGRTTGTPICLLIENTDARPGDYETLRDLYRPGHGDRTYEQKYGIRDHRGGGRASGRETAARVAAGAVARKVLDGAGIFVSACTRELGGIAAEGYDPAEVERNGLFCPDPEAVPKMRARLEEARRLDDSVGGIVEIRVRGCPPGLGEPVFQKMDADLAGALMGIGTVKGVEIGAGFGAARMTGSRCNDPVGADDAASNNAGGILAGITTGREILIRAASKPIPSIGIPQETLDRRGNRAVIEIRGRHDVCVIPRIVPVCEAMVRIVLADHFLRQKAVRGA